MIPVIADAAAFFLLPLGEGAGRRMRAGTDRHYGGEISPHPALTRHPLPGGEGWITRLLLALLLLLFPLAASAHEGHDHGEAKAAPAAASPRFEGVGDAITVVGIAKGHELTLYLDRLATNEPVDGAKVDVTYDGKVLSAEPRGDGVYAIEAPWLDIPGTKDLTVAVSAGEIADLLPGTLEIPEPAHAETAATPITWKAMLASPHGLVALGIAFAIGFVLALAIPRGRRAAAAATIAIAALATPIGGARAHEGHDHGPEPAAVTGDAPRRLPDGSVFVPKPSQRLIGVRTAVTKMEEHPRVTELIGTVLADPSASGKVQSTLAGRVDAGNGTLPHIGQAVARGDVLAAVLPSVSVVDRGGVAGQIAELSGSIQVAEQRVRRLRQLEGSVPQREIDEAQGELNALRQRRAAVSPTLAEREQLRAPVSGVIAAVAVQAGQVVDAREVLFEIVDPARLWVEAIAFDPAVIGDIGAARAVTGDTSVPLTFLARNPALRQQMMPLIFRVEGKPDGLSLGRPVTVLLESKRKLSGIALPQDAVVRGANGLPQVFEHVTPETFRPLPVRTEVLDGRRVLAAGGLKGGERIVITGAELLNQVR